MKHPFASLLLASAVLLPGLLATPARAATMLLHSFRGDDGAHPYGSLTLADTKLYGMTNDGPFTASSRGTLFSMNTDGTGFTVLHSFAGSPTDGRNPYGSLTLSGARLYGMTNQGGATGYGTIFSMNTDGTGYSLLRSFNFPGPTYPTASLTLSGSKLYGTTGGGGGGANSGTVFSMNTDGTGFSLLHSFAGGINDGTNPGGDLTLIGSKLYGTTTFGGSADRGVLFSLNIDGSGYSVLHTFLGGVSDGSMARGALVPSEGAFFGTTGGGGSSNAGTLFRIGTDGTGFTVLHHFSGGTTDGSSPTGSITLSGSTFYGMTIGGGASGNGTLFQIDTDGTDYSVLESFLGNRIDAALPLYSSPTVSEDGAMLYGMTRFGGTGNSGAVFSRAVPEPGSFAMLGLGVLLLSTRRRSGRV